MKVLFWGTPAFAVPSLNALDGEGHQVVGVVTQPDRPAGRGRQLSPSAVKEVAIAEGYPVFSPDRPRGAEFLGQLSELEPEISVVVAYGHILLPEVLDLPTGGSVNVHASLLPRLRGAAPINWAIVRGEQRTGVTIMRMTPGMDAGPIILQVEEEIGTETSASDLSSQLSELGAEALVSALGMLEMGVAEEREQDHELATFAPKLDRSIAKVDWSGSAQVVANHIRGMDAVPGAWSTLGGQPVKFFRPRVLSHSGSGLGDGAVLSPVDGSLTVSAGGGALLVEEVQPAGKRRMASADWLLGQGPRLGECFV